MAFHRSFLCRTLLIKLHNTSTSDSNTQIFKNVTFKEKTLPLNKSTKISREMHINSTIFPFHFYIWTGLCTNMISTALIFPSIHSLSHVGPLVTWTDSCLQLSSGGIPQSFYPHPNFVEAVIIKCVFFRPPLKKKKERSLCFILSFLSFMKVF